jgi:hypothetical protein
MGALLSPDPMFRAYDNNNNPLVGGQLYTYQAGTTTPAATYTDSTAVTPNSNPVVLNARGEAPVWLSPTQAYKLVLKDANGNTIWTVDQVTSPAPVAVGNMTDEKGLGGLPGFVNGVDFTAGTTTTLTLSQNYGSSANLWVAFDAAEQGADTFTLSGTTLTFNAPIPNGTTKVYVKGGASLATGSIANGSVTDASIATNAGIQSTKLAYNQGSTGAVTRTVQSRLQDAIFLSDFGAVGDGVADDTAAVQAAINAAAATHKPLYLSPGNYKITSTLMVGNGTATTLSTVNGICMRGISTGATAAEVGAPGAPVKFTWAGTAGGTMMLIAGPIYGVDLSGFELDCAAIAGTGIHFSHPINSKFDQILVQQYTSIGIIHDAYSNMTGLAVGSQHNLFDDVTAKYPAAGGNGASFGAASSGSSPFLDVAQNVYRNCEWWRDGNSSVTYSMRLQFIDNCTFIDCETSALSANNGVGIYVVPVTGAPGFPAACTFINSPIQGGVAASTSWAANEGLLFWPYPVGDGEPIPSTPTPKQLYGITSKGDYFGGLSIGVGNTPISQHISATFPLAFSAVPGQSYSVQAVNVPNAALGDTVVVAWDNGPFPGGLVLSATVAAAGTVDVIWTNATGGSVTPAPGNYRIDVWKH